MALDLSVTIPVFNEAESLSELHRQLAKILAENGLTHELIFVDDGSTDGTFSALRELASADPSVRVVRLTRNFGQHVALAAGIERSRGDIVILMDADLQNDPADIPKLVAKVRQGYELVSGWRVNRRELSLIRRAGSALLNRLLTFSTGVALHDYNCAFKAMTRRVAREVSQYGHLRRYLAPLLVTAARSVTEVPVTEHARRQGRSRYTMIQIGGLLLDFVTGFSARPFRVVGLGGLGCTLLGMAGGGAYLAGRMAFGIPASDRLIFLIFLLTVLGVQLVILGLLGEYVVRTYHAAQHLPLYTVDEELGADGSTGERP